jgi:hypothetical protein
VLYNSNKGSEVAGARTDPSRLGEPYWDFVGGALQLSRMVPDPDVGVVIKVAMSMRVTDNGDFEVIKQRRQMDFVDGEYVDGPVNDAQVVARFGHTSVKAPTMLLRNLLTYPLGAVVEDTIAFSAYPLTTALANGAPPLGLNVQPNNILSGTVTTVAPADFAIVAVADVDGDESANVAEFQQRSGVTGIGGEFGLPVDVAVVEPAGSFSGFKPDYLFITKAAGMVKDNQFWHSATDNGFATFDVSYPAPTTVSHVRVWSHCHGASQNIQRTLIYGNGALIAEYGVESRPPLEEIHAYAHDDLEWRTAWSELAPGVTLAIPSPSAYTTYTISFPDSANQTHVTLGRMQLLNVPSDASIPVGLFLTPPEWRRSRVVYISESVARSTALVVAADAPANYSLVVGTVLPSGLTLSTDGVLTGQAVPGSDGAAVDVRALIGLDGGYASTTQTLWLAVVEAVYTLAITEISTALTHGDTVSRWNCFTQSDPLLQPTYNGARHVTMSTGQRLSIATETDRFVPGGGMTIAIRIRINEIDADAHILTLGGNDPDRIVLKRHQATNELGLRVGGVDTSTLISNSLGAWQTVTATFADGNVATYRDGVLVTQFLATTPVAVTYPEVILGQTEGVGSLIDIRNVQVYARALSVGEIVLSHLKASAFFRLSTLEFMGLEDNVRVSQWDTFVAPSVDARPRFNAVEQHLTFDGSQYLEATYPSRGASIASGGGITAIIRIRIRSHVPHGRMIELYRSNYRLLSKIPSAGVVQTYAGPSNSEYPITMNTWITHAVALDAETGRMRTFQDGVKRLDHINSVWENDGTDFEWIRILANGADADISHAAFWSSALSDAEIQAYIADITPV